MSEIQFAYNPKEAKVIRWVLFVPVAFLASFLFSIPISILETGSFFGMLVGSLAWIGGMAVGIRVCPSPRLVGVAILMVIALGLIGSIMLSMVDPPNLWRVLLRSTPYIFFYTLVLCGVAIHFDRRDRRQATTSA